MVPVRGRYRGSRKLKWGYSVKPGERICRWSGCRWTKVSVDESGVYRRRETPAEKYRDKNGASITQNGTLQMLRLRKDTVI